MSDKPLLPSKTYEAGERRIRALRALQTKLHADPRYTKQTMKVIEAAIVDLEDRQRMASAFRLAGILS